MFGQCSVLVLGHVVVYLSLHPPDLVHADLHDPRHDHNHHHVHADLNDPRHDHNHHLFHADLNDPRHDHNHHHVHADLNEPRHDHNHHHVHADQSNHGCYRLLFCPPQSKCQLLF